MKPIFLYLTLALGFACVVGVDAAAAESMGRRLERSMRWREAEARTALMEEKSMSPAPPSARFQEVVARVEAGKTIEEFVMQPVCTKLYQGSLGGEDLDGAMQVLVDMFHKYWMDTAQKITDAIGNAVAKGFAKWNDMIGFLCTVYDDFKTKLDFTVSTCKLVGGCNRDVFCLEPSRGFKCKLKNLCLPISWHTKFGIPYKVDRCINFDQTARFRLDKLLPTCPRSALQFKNHGAVITKIKSIIMAIIEVVAQIRRWTTKALLWVDAKFIGLTPLLGAIVRDVCLKNHPPPAGELMMGVYQGACRESLKVNQARLFGSAREAFVTILESKQLWKKFTKLIPIVDIIVEIMQDVTDFYSGKACLEGLEKLGKPLIDNLVAERNRFLNA